MLGLTQYREMHGDCWNRKRREARIKGSNVLVVDAFSGDAIPVHLLTREAFEA